MSSPLPVGSLAIENFLRGEINDGQQATLREMLGVSGSAWQSVPVALTETFSGSSIFLSPSFASLGIVGANEMSLKIEAVNSNSTEKEIGAVRINPTAASYGTTWLPFMFPGWYAYYSNVNSTVSVMTMRESGDHLVCDISAAPRNASEAAFFFPVTAPYTVGVSSGSGGYGGSEGNGQGQLAAMIPYDLMPLQTSVAVPLSQMDSTAHFEILTRDQMQTTSITATLYYR